MLELEGPFELGEVAAGRSAPEYVRWVQRALNSALGTRLDVDGRGGPATRKAVAQFQRQPSSTPTASSARSPRPGWCRRADRPRRRPLARQFGRRLARPLRSLVRCRRPGQGTQSARSGHRGRRPGRCEQGARVPVRDGRSRRIFLLHDFKIDGASLRPEHKQYLEELARWMRSGPPRGWQVFAEAHASRTGTARHDDILSEDRYLVMRAFLESQLLRLGVDAARLRMYGEGVGFRHSPLPGEDPRARSVYGVVQPDPSPSPPPPWPPPIVPVAWPPAQRVPRPVPVPPLPVPPNRPPVGPVSATALDPPRWGQSPVLVFRGTPSSGVATPCYPSSMDRRPSTPWCMPSILPTRAATLFICWAGR